MDEDNNMKRNFWDITQYPEKTRKIIFGVVVGLLLVVVGLAMFVVSPKNDASLQAAEQEDASAVTATQAPVDSEISEEMTPTAPDREEAVTPEEDLSGGEGVYTSEQEEAEAHQQKIIEESLKREKEQTDEVIEDAHPVIKNAAKLQDIATKGMLEYCTTNPDETKEEKQARMKPYFHIDNSDYRSPENIFYVVECSLEGVTEPHHDSDENIVVNVGMAWGGQYEKDGTAETGYTQYSVIVDENGIVSFHD